MRLHNHALQAVRLSAVAPGSGKGLFDVCAAAVALVLLAPLMAVVALLVRLTSRGPVLYRQERVGQGGRLFTIYKFRSMRVDAERNGAQWALRDDPRATPIGAFLRRTHLDELPQLVNVVKGEMSLVGPRPERPVFVNCFSGHVARYRERLAVKPGITGLAQIFHHADESLDDVRVKLAYDLHYIQARDFWMDLWILQQTARKMTTGRTLEEARERLVERIA